MTALGSHAIAELAYQDVDETTAGDLTAIIGYFAGFSDEDRPQYIEWVLKLLKFEVLSPLTDDPAEWAMRDDYIPGQQIWQSNRWPDAWSYSEEHANYFLISQHNPAGVTQAILFPTIPAP